MPTPITLPTCLAEVYEYLFPTINFSRVKIYDGIPFYLNKGQGGITIASVGLSSDIKIYLKEGSYYRKTSSCPPGPCSFDTFITIAHELVHVLQIQDGLGKGYIPGEWIYKYVTCYVGWFKFSDRCDNKFEKEAYDYAGGCTTTKSGLLNNCVAITFQRKPPCDCCTPAWYRQNKNNDETLLQMIQKNGPALVKKSSSVCDSWKCSLNPVAAVIGFSAGLLSIFGLVSAGGVIGMSIGIVIGLIGWGLIGAFMVGIMGSIIGIAINWLIALFSSVPRDRILPVKLN